MSLRRNLLVGGALAGVGVGLPILPAPAAAWPLVPSGGDDTVRLQSAIDNLAQTGGDLALSGLFRVSNTVSLRNRSGITLTGNGCPNMYTAGTRLLWAGPNDSRPMMDFSGTSFCGLRSIGLLGNAAAPGLTANVVGIRAVGNPTANGSFFNHFERVFFQNLSTGVDLGDIQDQVDTYTFDKCWWFMGPDATGLRIRSRNSLLNQLRACTLTVANGTGAGSGSAIQLDGGSVQLYGCLTAGNGHGLRITNTPHGPVGLYGCHSEQDGYAIFTDPQGNHQKAQPLRVDTFFNYFSLHGLFYFGNANIVYRVTSAHSVPATGNDDIIVPDNPQEVWLDDVTFNSTVRRLSDGAPVDVYGRYGPQTASQWPLRLPKNRVDVA